MVREHHVAVLPANHVNAFCMRPTTNTQSHVKCTYMIGREHSHVVLPNHARISPYINPDCYFVTDINTCYFLEAPYPLAFSFSPISIKELSKIAHLYFDQRQVTIYTEEPNFILCFNQGLN